MFKYLTYNLIFFTLKYIFNSPLPFYGKCRNSRNVSFVFCDCTTVVFPGFFSLLFSIVVVVLFYCFSLLLLLPPLSMLLECVVVVFEVI